MKVDRRWYGAIALTSALAMALIGGCKKEHNGSDREASAEPTAGSSARPLGPDSSPVTPSLDEGWCGGHGVPESVCTRCNSSLSATFKNAGDWCAEHGLPESQCFICHPEVEIEWAKLNPTNEINEATATTEKKASNPALGPGSSPVAPTLDEGWCGGHGVPESVCTRCNSSLLAAFKNAGDWCAEHGLPESQCFSCHPELEAEWAKLDPDAMPNDRREDDSQAKIRPSAVEDTLNVRVERTDRILTGTNDPLCQVENLRVRFPDPGIVERAGIKVKRAQRRPMSATLAVPAEAEFDATRLARITPRIAGIVLSTPVQIGEDVEPGNVLAVVDSPVLGEAKSEYIERTQNLRLSKSDLTRADTIYRGVQRMLDVCTPESDAETIREALSESPVGESKAKLLRAHAELLLARSEHTRQATLQKKHVAAEREFQIALSALAATEAEFVAAKEEIAFDVERNRIAAQRDVEVARSALESAQRRMHILGLRKTQIENIGNEPVEMLSRFELTSPVAGVVVERNVAVGENVEANDPLFVVVDTSTMWVMADLYERDLIRVRLGLPVLFTSDGMRGFAFEGILTWISSRVDDRTRTVRVRANLPNPDGLLRASMFGIARIILRDNEEVVTVPADAIQTDGCCQLVFVKESDTVFQPRKVMLGTSANGVVEVLTGLDEGEVVASAGSFLMKTEILKNNIGAGCCEVDPGR